MPHAGALPTTIQIQIQKKWVINISDRSLDEDETRLLERGLNYAITPTVFPTHDYIVAVESACCHIGADSECAAALRAYCVKVLKRPPCQDMRGERVALKRLKQLRPKCDDPAS